MLVVIADDDRDAILSLSELLRLSIDGALQLELAFDGAEALAVATHGPVPDVVILDIEMPRMNGFDAAQAIRRALGTGPTLIAISGNVGRADLAGLTSTFDHALRKPVDVERLLALIRARAER